MYWDFSTANLDNWCLEWIGALIKTAYLINRTFHRFIPTFSANYNDITGHLTNYSMMQKSENLNLQIMRCFKMC